MFYLFLLVLFCGVCDSDEGDLGYGLNIGNAIDVFANYGDLSQVTQVVSADYEEDSKEYIVPFSEKNIRVFVNATFSTTFGEGMTNMDVQLYDTFDDLLDSYFNNFQIEGTTKPWKAFMGDWIVDEIMRTFGLEYDAKPDNCCYVLVKLAKITEYLIVQVQKKAAECNWPAKIHKTVELDDLEYVPTMEYVKRAIKKLDVDDPSDIRRFMKSYGTHYIDSYVTGNFIYQVFKYKRAGYNMLKTYTRIRNRKHLAPDNLRFYFSSYFLKQIGDIRVASGNKTVETWAKWNLRDSQYLYSRPSLMRLHYNPLLMYKLKDLLDNKALLGLKLKILTPIFRDRRIAEKYSEIVENDLLLWEVNG